jgi:hypothetical protein
MLRALNTEMATWEALAQVKQHSMRMRKMYARQCQTECMVSACRTDCMVGAIGNRLGMPQDLLCINACIKSAEADAVAALEGCSALIEPFAGFAG